MIEDSVVFGRLVRDSRQALGMTQRELALAVNTGERFIVELEGGKPTCQLGKALAVAKAVGIELIDRRTLRADEGRASDDVPGLEP